jgi:hypothetical protein
LELLSNGVLEAEEFANDLAMPGRSMRLPQPYRAKPNLPPQAEEG